MFFKNHGILGINARNLLYIRPYNPKKAIKMADDKIKTKQFLSARGVPVPKLFSIIRDHDELERFDFDTLPNNFVIKPNHGYGGEGIIPITAKKDGFWITAGGKKLSKTDLHDHINDILDGRFSISNIADSAFFEQLIISDERIGKYSYEGLPDIRVVVHNLIPVMAMLRLPTEESGGKANIHLGAVGVGIDIAKGVATHIAYKNRIIEELPGGLGKIRGLKIPYWDEILHISSNVQLTTNLGYMACDLCIDKNSGPVLLEINARAGLAVQIANLAPLRKRLERIEGVKVTSVQKGVRIAKDMFGNTVEKEITHLSGKEVIRTEEEVEIIQKQGVFRILAKIDTGRERSIIDQEIANTAGLLDSNSDYDDEKSTLKTKFVLKNKRIQTVVDVEKVPSEKYKMIIGSRDLKDFLIDTSTTSELPKEIPKIPATGPLLIKKTPQGPNFHKIDQQLIAIDNKIKLLYHLKPINLEKEQQKFFSDPSHNPQFEYPKLKFDPLELVDKLEKIELDDSPMGKLYAEKKREISDKIALLEAIDEEKFSEISVRLFENPTPKEAEECKEAITKMDIERLSLEKGKFNAEQAKEKFEEVFRDYGLKNWKVKIKENMVAGCVAGKNNRLFVRANNQFTQERIDSLIVHEIETHILTAENGKMQPFEIFNRGLADYLITQEGLAVYNVEQQLGMSFTETSYRSRAHVVAIHAGLNGASFSEVYNLLLQLGLPIKDAFHSTLKSKRGFMDTSKGGAFTKDYVYYKGYQQVKKFIEEGGNIKDLYIGKMNVRDVENAKSVPGIKSPRILPHWLKK